MLNFFKRSENFPEFTELNNYVNKDMYFVRTAQWYYLDDKNISVVDPKSPRLFTLDEWPQLVFIAANGQMTAKDYVYYIAGKYNGDIPPELDKTIIYQLNQLNSFGIIKFVQQKERPEKLFELPG